DRSVDELLCGTEELFIDRRHASDVERAGILDTPVRVRVDDASRTVLLSELRILRIEVPLGFLFGVQVIEIAEELVEPMLGRQVLVAITEVILAELPRRIALRLHHVGYCGSPRRNAVRIAGHSDRQ